MLIIVNLEHIERQPLQAKVLIVDDDNAIAKEMAEALMSQGFRVRYMTSASDAADYIESGMPVAVVLLDINMPGTNGMMFIQELRRSAR